MGIVAKLAKLLLSMSHLVSHCWPFPSS